MSKFLQSTNVIDMLNFYCEFCLACILNNISQKLQRMITIYTCNFSKHLLIYFQDCGTTTVGFGTSTTTQTPSNNAGQYQGGRGVLGGSVNLYFKGVLCEIQIFSITASLIERTSPTALTDVKRIQNVKKSCRP